MVSFRVLDWPCIGAVCEQLSEERELSEQGGQQQDAAVPVLDVSRRHQHVQHQTECIDKDMAFLAFDQLARIKAVWIDAGPPFSALFTLWLSTTSSLKEFEGSLIHGVHFVDGGHHHCSTSSHFAMCA